MLRTQECGVQCCIALGGNRSPGLREAADQVAIAGDDTVAQALCVSFADASHIGECTQHDAQALDRAQHNIAAAGRQFVLMRVETGKQSALAFFDAFAMRADFFRAIGPQGRHIVLHTILGVADAG